ncbi:MAG: hypothetical protein ACI8WY_003894, partial [Planctomycetota bacterium]
RKILSHFAALRTETARARGGIDQLSQTYGQTEPEKLIQPAPAGQLPSMPNGGPMSLPEPLIPHVPGSEGSQDAEMTEQKVEEVAGTDTASAE